MKYSKTPLPFWRKTKHGMSLCGKCLNSKCPAFNDWVWVSHEFGNFNIAKLNSRSKCPECEVQLKECENISFSMCLWDIDGLGNNNSSNIEKGIQYEPRKYITFTNGGKVAWQFLEIYVQPLPKN